MDRGGVVRGRIDVKARGIRQRRQMTDGEVDGAGAEPAADQVGRTDEEIEAVGLPRQVMRRPELVGIGVVELKVADRAPGLDDQVGRYMLSRDVRRDLRNPSSGGDQTRAT